MKKIYYFLIFSVFLSFLLHSSTTLAQDTTIIDGPLTFAITNAACAYEPQGAINLTVDQVAFPGPYSYF